MASQDVAVTGQVFRLAQADVTPDPIVLNARVGDTVQQVLTISNIAAGDGFSEQLGVSSAGATGDAQLSGAVAGLIAAQGSDSNLIASLNTSSSGAKTGTVALAYTSDGTATSGLAAIANGSSSVSVTGNVWDKAVADVQPGSIDFGIVHVGDSIAQSLQVSNTATVTALNDVLTGRFSATSGPFSASGDLGAGLAAGDTDNSSMNVGMDTGAAGVFTGSASVALASHNIDMADLILNEVDISLSGQVNNFANPVYDFVSGDGSFSGGGNSFLLDFGTFNLGSSDMLSTTLAAGNDVLGLADLLDGLFDISATGLFAASNFDAFFNLDSGEFINNLIVGLDTSGLGLGLIEGNIVLNATEHNASGYSNDFDPITLTMRARIVDASVPEPGSLILVLLGLMALWHANIRNRTFRQAGNSEI